MRFEEPPMSQVSFSAAETAGFDLTSTSGTSPGAAPDIATICAQAGRGERDGEPLVTPIVQSTTFARAGLESAAEHTYSRASNPTVSELERALARIEDAPHAVAFATGLAAETALLVALCKAGDHVVCSRALYGGTTRLLGRI